jgi:hypothetical protein
MASQLTSKAISAYVEMAFDSSAEGAAEPREMLHRLSAIHENLQRLSIKISIVYIVAVLFYLIRIAGLRFDIIIFDQKIFQVPYGIFLFCIVVQLAYMLQMVISTDARMYQRYIEIICEKCWPNKNELVKQSYIGMGLPINAISRFLSYKSNSISGRICSILSIPVVLFATAIYFSPIICGIWFLVEWEKQITSGDVDLQYYSVMISTVSAVSISILGIFIYYIDDDDGQIMNGQSK